MPVVVFALLFVAGYNWVSSQEINWRHEQRDKLEDIAVRQASVIEQTLSRSMISAYLLGHFIKEQAGDKSGFETYAEKLIQEVGGVTNLQLAPNGIIENIYPLKGHERALGFNIFSQRNRQQEALLAVESRQLIIVGPINLVQGGTGVIGRFPVFLETKDGESFWGLTSALVTLDKLLASVDLQKLSEQDIAYQLWHINPHTQEKYIFAGQTQRALTPPIASSTINLANNNWYLDVAFTNPPAHSSNYWVDIALCFFVSLLFSSLLFMLLQLPDRLQKKVAQQTQQLAEMAFYDTLTKLPNRKLFNDRLLQAIHKQARSNQPFALLFIDIDGFKRINDTLGHEAGDNLLVLVAQRLKERIRKSDTAARLGGDEFTLLLSDLESDTSKRITSLMHFAQEVLDLLNEPFAIGSHTVTTSASIGITLCPEDGTEASTMLRNADMAMYHAKQQGKNCFHFFSESMNLEANKRLELEQDLEIALRENQFSLAYQPILSVSSGKTVALEALLRWNHPTKGPISPDTFIPLAETTGLILSIGNFVLSKATEEIQVLNQGRDNPIKLNVNLSPKELGQAEFAHKVINTLKKTGFNPAWLYLELTESALIENYEETAEVLHRLKEAGICLSIDDFGTGYSSLSLLKKLPVDNLKIDRMFIRDIPDDSNDMEITAAVILMAKKLGLTVTAEGVETSEQEAFLQQNSCDLVQGFYYCKPLPVEQILPYLNTPPSVETSV